MTVYFVEQSRAQGEGCEQHPPGKGQFTSGQIATTDWSTADKTRGLIDRSYHVN